MRTVLRPAHRRSAYVDDLLRRLAEAGFEGTPRPLGYDKQGWQILSYIEGFVPSGEGPFLLSDARIRSAAVMIRAFHDATAAAFGEVVCHGDLGPHNTVFRGEEAVGLIDFEDDVGPGRRLDDFAQAVWGFADLTDPDLDVGEMARRTRLMCTAYGGVTPPEIVTALTERFQRAHDQHTAAGLTGAVEVFDGLLAWMARSGDRVAHGG
jgi:Ser/Thr protein kinase RdoA (MazF antagonist)